MGNKQFQTGLKNGDFCFLSLQKLPVEEMSYIISVLTPPSKQGHYFNITEESLNCIVL